MSHVRILKHYFHTPYLVLAWVEMLMMVPAVPVAYWIRYGHLPQELLGTLPGALTFAAVMSVAMMSLGVYPSRLREGFAGMMLRTAVSLFLIGAVALSLIFYVFPATEVYRSVLAIAAVLSFFLVGFIRVVTTGLFEDERLKRRVLVLGTGAQARRIATRLRRKSDRRAFSIIGYVAVEGCPVQIEDANVRIVHLLGRKLLDFADQEDVDELVVALDDRRRNREAPLSAAQVNGGHHGGAPALAAVPASTPVVARARDAVDDPASMQQLLDCRLSGIDVIDVLSFFEREVGKIEIDLLRPSWLVFSDGFAHNSWRSFTKRAFDIAASSALLLITWPIMLVTAFLIWAESGFKDPVFYRQVRVGLGGRPFEVMKFRSMRTDAEKDGKARWASRNDDRITRVGHVIRNTRIDELPQILNVLRGEMSFVGPRPERPEFVERLEASIPYYAERHRIKPGITGWAQLCYPYGASDEDAKQKLQYDLYYLKNHSLLLDLIIMIQTVEVILIGDGAR